MGSQQLWGTSAGVPTVESYYQQAIWGDDTRQRPDFDYQRRAIKTYRDRNSWASLWPRGMISMGDPTGQEMVMDPCFCFEPYSCDGEGTQTSNFILGRVLDVSSNPVAAIVQGFRTSDDAFVGEVNAKADGYYILPTFNGTGVAHYLVAYNAGAPDRAGTTVNTITPTKVDGT